MSNRDTYNSRPDPVKIGVLSDMPEILNRAKLRTAELVRHQYAARLERPIEFVVHEFHGAPASTTRNAIDGFRALVDQGCVIVVGCNHSDNCRVQLAESDRSEVPLISLGASEDLVSDYGFTVGWGSIPHDAYILANWCRTNSYARVTVTSDKAWHCQEYLRHFRAACGRWNIRILSEAAFSEFSGQEQDRQAQEYVREHRGLNPDAILHFGSSTAAETWALAVHEAGWNVPRAMNAVFFRISQPRGESIVGQDNQRNERIWLAREGWLGSSVVDEENETLNSAVRAYESLFGEKPFAIDGMANYYDAFRVAIEAVISAHLLSPQGVKAALERLKYLPAAAGGASTTIGFGPWDHMGVKGKDLYVLRRIQDGQTVLAHRYNTSV